MNEKKPAPAAIAKTTAGGYTVFTISNYLKRQVFGGI
jgi:hypothetical protein